MALVLHKHTFIVSVVHAKLFMLPKQFSPPTPTLLYARVKHLLLFRRHTRYSLFSSRPRPASWILWSNGGD